ncbi:MAG: Gfo/Idh/MocA family oxidoreductase, partial [Thermodesulfobacteriota bacterium]|nr:Gfo/Idh/MocA family oxidoreductase [Thermodesulfobacteriota bacterium]
MKRVKVAVVGVGYLGEFHAEKYAAMSDVDLIGVVDIDEKRLSQVAQKVGSKPYIDYKEILDRVEAVSIAVPTTLHSKIAIPFLEKGIAVLLEKPMTSNLDEGRRIIDAVNRGKGILQIGHLERFNPAIIALAGSIKRPMFIEVHRISPFKKRSTDVDVILDLMIHDIDIILSLVDSKIASVEAVGVPVLTDQVDIANVRVRFESGCIANITASRVSLDVMRKIRIFQPDSYISIDYAKKAVDIYRLSSKKQIVHENTKISDTDALEAEIRAFVDAVRFNKRPVVDGIAGLTSIKV